MWIAFPPGLPIRRLWPLQGRERNRLRRDGGQPDTAAAAIAWTNLDSKAAMC